MPRFSRKSKQRLSTCDERLQKLFKEVVKEFDCTVIEGYRNKAKQDAAYNSGHSKVKFPNGKHNKTPSAAVDVAPWPVDWDDRDRFHYFAGFVHAKASEMGIKIRWGGNWRMDLKDGFKKNKFDDLVHYEIVK